MAVASASSQVVGRRKNGEEFPLEAAISRFEEAGQQALIVSLRDITEQQRAEAEMKRWRVSRPESLPGAAGGRRGPSST